jgi:hypothetical protein
VTEADHPEADSSSESKPAEERAAEENAKRQRLDLYSVRLRADQVAYLKTLPNASEWVRRAIDEARARDPATSTANQIILLTRQLKDVEQQIKTINENSMRLDAYKQRDQILWQKHYVELAVEFCQKTIQGEIKPREKENPPSEVRFYVIEPSFEWKEGRTLRWIGTTPEAVVENAKGEAAKALAELQARQASLDREEAKQGVIIGGFEEETRALEAKHRSLEDELLQAGTPRSGIR